MQHTAASHIRSDTICSYAMVGSCEAGEKQVQPQSTFCEVCQPPSGNTQRKAAPAVPTEAGKGPVAPGQAAVPGRQKPRSLY